MPTDAKVIIRLLYEIKDELRKLNERTESMPQGIPATPQPRLAAKISSQLDPRYLENRSSILSDSRASEGTSFPRVTLEAAIDQYLAQKQHEVSPQHLTIVELTLRGFDGSCSKAGAHQTLWEVTRPCVLERRQQLLDAGKTTKTVNNHIAILGAFFQWCVDEAGLRDDNPAAGLKLKDRTKASRKRKAFTPEQIAHVFTNLTDARLGSPAHEWLPLIMLYTGARPEEVAQLRVGDVRQVHAQPLRAGEPTLRERTWVFDFATMDDGQRRKNEASRRLVPVHPRLWELGLEGLLRKTATEIRENDPNRLLFPELKPGANGRLAETPSRWFNQTWLRKVKGIEDRKLVLYSLRHAVATHLKHAGIEESMIAQLLGHANSSMTTGRYGKEYPVEKLMQAVSKLDWKV